MAAARDSETLFRNFLPGLKGRRDDLLRRRRDELATMPHALRGIYVARVARVSATLAAALGGGFLVTVAATPGAQEFLSMLMPGQLPAVLSSILLGTLIVSVLAYLLGRCVAEARFTRAMSKCVLPSTDNDEEISQDVERLRHVRPDQMASSMIHRFESPAAALPPAAVALALPCILAYGLMALMRMGYPLEAEVDGAFARYAGTLVSVGAAGVAAAFFLVWTRARTNVKRSAAIATILAGFTAAVFSVFVGANPLLVFAGTTLVAGTIVGSLLLVRQERSIVLLEDADATLWTVGMAWDSFMSLAKSARQELTFAKFRAALGRPLIRRVLVLGGVSAIALYTYGSASPEVTGLRSEPGAKRVVAAVAPGQIDIDSAPAANSAPRVHSHTVTAELQLLLEPGKPTRLRDALGRSVYIPAGYNATVSVEPIVHDHQPLDGNIHVTVDGVEHAQFRENAVAYLSHSEEARSVGVVIRQTKRTQPLLLRYQIILTRAALD